MTKDKLKKLEENLKIIEALEAENLELREDLGLEVGMVKEPEETWSDSGCADVPEWEDSGC